jgi:hypothetical protein
VELMTAVKVAFNNALLNATCKTVLAYLTIVFFYYLTFNTLVLDV